ncbi:MAG TPA: ParA family protein, partial [Stellaceae bacterium]
MLTWFKRIAANSPREQTAETQTQTPSTEEKVERLVGRLGTGRKPEGEELAAEASHEDSQEAQVSQEVSQELPREIPREVPRVTSPTRVIAVAAQKGGAGKTTITAHLAVQAGLVGQGPVVLADTDPQGSLGQWSRARNDENLPLASVRLEELAANPAALRNSGAAIALIDTPPALTTSIEQVIGIADLILIPARPSPHDLRAIGATVELVR